MNKFVKFIGLITILICSFYYTEKLSVLVMSNNNLIKEIKSKSLSYSVSAFDAEINNQYIVPGLNGYQVDVLRSYDNMKEFNSFDSIFLEYYKILPKISVNNNKDKIIKSGNKKKKSVSLIVYNNQIITDYLVDLGINFSRIINFETFIEDANYEQLNGEIKNFNKLEFFLNKYNLNPNICIINYSKLSSCKKNKKFLVEPTLIFNNSNIYDIKKNIESGSIIFVEENVSGSNMKIILKQINYQDLDLVYLSNLISEDTNYK